MIRLGHLGGVVLVRFLGGGVRVLIRLGHLGGVVLVRFLRRRVRILVRFRDLRRGVAIGLCGALRRRTLGLGAQRFRLASGRRDCRGSLLVGVGPNCCGLTLQSSCLVLGPLNNRLGLGLGDFTLLGRFAFKSLGLTARRCECLLSFGLEALGLGVGGGHCPLRLAPGSVDEFRRFALRRDPQFGHLALNGGAERMHFTLGSRALFRNFRVRLRGDALRLAGRLRNELLGLSL